MFTVHNCDCDIQTPSAQIIKENKKESHVLITLAGHFQLMQFLEINTVKYGMVPLAF